MGFAVASRGGDHLRAACERVVNLERCFNAREGLTRKDDTLPGRFLKEPLGTECGPSAGSVVELEPMLDEYYEARGWDVRTGLPTASKLDSLGLKGCLEGSPGTVPGPRGR